MTDIKNIKETEELILRYRSITLEEIKNTKINNVEDIHNDNMMHWKRAEKLTGFGHIDLCTLCKACEDKDGRLDCRTCIHKLHAKQSNGIRCAIHHTFDAISHSKSNKQLLKAFKDRADYLEKLVDDYYRLEELHRLGTLNY